MRKYLFIAPAVMALSVSLTGCSSLYGGGGSAPVNTNAVSMKNLSFRPQNITVSVGTEVTFTNNDFASHTIVFDAFESGTLANGQSYKHTFNSAGTFNYYCSIHPSMKGSVIVQ